MLAITHSVTSRLRASFEEIARCLRDEPNRPESLEESTQSGRHGRSGRWSLLVEWEELSERIHTIDRELVGEAQQCEPWRRRLEVRGIGTRTATALATTVGDGKAFEKGHDIAA